jgi:hypothetical protein
MYALVGANKKINFAPLPEFYARFLVFGKRDLASFLSHHFP